MEIYLLINAKQFCSTHQTQCHRIAHRWVGRYIFSPISICRFRSYQSFSKRLKHEMIIEFLHIYSEHLMNNDGRTVEPSIRIACCCLVDNWIGFIIQTILYRIQISYSKFNTGWIESHLLQFSSCAFNCGRFLSYFSLSLRLSMSNEFLFSALRFINMN